MKSQSTFSNSNIHGVLGTSSKHHFNSQTSSNKFQRSNSVTANNINGAGGGGGASSKVMSKKQFNIERDHPKQLLSPPPP
jgi:hypothetical protein